MENAVVKPIIDAVPLPALGIDASERIIAANEDALALLGPNILDRNYVTMLRQPAILDAVEASLHDGQNRTTRYSGKSDAQDTTFSVSCRVVPQLGLGGRGIVILCFEDVTHIGQASQMRRDFVANVSHELRTPLTALMGFIETLKGPARDDAEARSRFLDIMFNEAGRMNRLVGDLLSLSRVEVDERVRPTHEIILNDILLSTINSIKPLADEANVALEVNVSDVPIPMIGDEDQLRQVFTNLIENAIKYGGTGGRVSISLTASVRERALRGPGASIRVKDYGVGIAAEHLPRLTERFYRVDDHRSRALGGTGLGLAIVKHIINRHRGRLRVESELGEGTCFNILLPILPISKG